NAGLLRLLPPKTPVRETRRRREPDSNHRSRLFKAASAARIFVFLTCDSAGSEGAQIPSVNPSFRSDILSCRAAGQVRRLAGCRAVDGHSKLLVDCLVEPMCQTRAGESGSWFGIAPNETKALATALAIRPPIGMIAPSPAPLTPSGLLGDRWFSSPIAWRHGKSVIVGIR